MNCDADRMLQDDAMNAMEREVDEKIELRELLELIDDD